ncbi:hypothetical protein AALC25_03140 [Lachnospiraceae bacterium 29-84]
MSLIDIFNMEYYNIGFIKESIELIIDNKGNASVFWMKHPYKDRFFADPFLFEEETGCYWILAEEYTVYDRKGRIVLLKVDKNDYNLLRREVLIDEKTHLSFPYFYNGKIYPENYRSGLYYSYQVRNKKLIKETVAPMACIDPVLYDKDGERWLFTSFANGAMEKLYLYYKSGKDWVFHPNNPIVQDIRTARMAGHIFEIRGVAYRPVQDCEKRYGNRVRIMEIIELSKTTYKEKEVAILDSVNYKPYNEGLHTLNVESDVILIDGYMKKRKVMLRIMYAIKKRLFSRKIKREMKSVYEIIKE